MGKSSKNKLNQTRAPKKIRHLDLSRIKFDSFESPKDSLLRSMKPWVTGNPKPGRYHVFIDESEFEKEKLLSLGAVLIPDHQLKQLNRDVDRLRATIGSQMRRKKFPIYFADDAFLKEKKVAMEADRIRNGGLPEIHAKDMWHSERSYFCERSSDSLIQRNDWVHKVTKIVEKYDIVFFPCNFQGKFRQFSAINSEDLLAILDEHITPDISRKKVHSTFNDIHFILTFELFLLLDSLSELGIEILSITYDKGKRSELFGKFSGFDLARQYGYWKNFPNPQSEDSHLSNGLQVADFCTYFLAKEMYTREFTSFSWKIYERIRTKLYTIATSAGRASLTEPTPVNDRDQRLFEAMAFEAALLHCGGQTRTLHKRQESVAKLIRTLLGSPTGNPFATQLAEAGIASYTGPVWSKCNTKLQGLQRFDSLLWTTFNLEEDTDSTALEQEIP